MGSQRMKVAVGMSGGVDSSVAAALLIEAGYDVHGVSLRMWEGNGGPRICSDYRGAQEIAAELGIPHTLIDLRSQFANTVVRPFAADYLRGRTPNPCVACNRDFKFGTMLKWAKERRIDYVATGHYARVVRHADGRHDSLWRGADRGKDQSYFLFALSRQQLAHTLFPLGEMEKTEVRALARRLKLPVAERPESQDICFGDYKALVESYASPGAVAGGDVVDRSGKVLGRHGGIHGVTIGQRKGLGVSADRPLYVVDIQAESNQVVLGTREELCCKGLRAGNISWIEPPTGDLTTAAVQIRYRSAAVPCVVQTTAAGTVEVGFTEDCPAVAPGQAAVFYRGDQLLGGGWIEQALR